MTDPITEQDSLEQSEAEQADDMDDTSELLNMRTKAGKVEFLAQHLGEEARAELEELNIAELSGQVKQVQQAIKQQLEQQAAHPGLIRPGQDPMEFDSLRGNIQVGRVEIEDGTTVAIDEIVAYRGRDLHPATGAHQLSIINPRTGLPGIVVFEKKLKVFERDPVAIVRDWRTRAQALFVPMVRVTNPTLGTQTIVALSRNDGEYYLPFDVVPDRQMIRRMTDYVKGQINIVDEEEQLASKIAAELIPEAEPSGGR